MCTKGDHVCISCTNSSTCPVVMLQRYLLLSGILGNSDEFIFRQLSYCKKSNIYKLLKANVPLSYTRIRELILSAFTNLGLDVQGFGVHSLRSDRRRFRPQ